MKTRVINFIKRFTAVALFAPAVGQVVQAGLQMGGADVQGHAQARLRPKPGGDLGRAGGQGGIGGLGTAQRNSAAGMIIATQKLTHIMCMTLVLEPSLPEPNSAAW